MSGPLAGLRVLDLTSIVFGPYAMQILGDMGADVIKVEPPEGDGTRHTGPGRSPGMAAMFMGINRSKRSLVLDLKQPAGRDALWRLIDGADVIAHSMRPQKMDRLGFGHAAVCARNPRIVYAGLHGYSDAGPYSGQPAYDDVIQGQTGVTLLMAEVAGEPRYAPMILADKTCGLTAAYAIAAALVARERTGKGQFVEIPMFESMASFVLTEHLFGHNFVPPNGPLGYSRVLASWRRPYPTRDGHICMLAYTDPQWRKFWDLVDRPEMVNDPRFDTLANRTINITELYQLAGEFLRTRNTDEWLPLLRERDIPTARISSLDDVMKDPHLQAVGFFKQVAHPTEGQILMTDLPVHFSETQASIERLQPRLGEHSREVLREAGFSGAEIDALIATGATRDAPPAAEAAE